MVPSPLVHCVVVPVHCVVVHCVVGAHCGGYAVVDERSKLKNKSLVTHERGEIECKPKQALYVHEGGTPIYKVYR